MLPYAQSRKVVEIGSTSKEVAKNAESVEAARRMAVQYQVNLMNAPRDKEEQTGPVRLLAVTNGEVTDPNWVDEQLKQFRGISAFFTLRQGNFGETLSYFGIPAYVAKPRQTVDPDEINLLYADRAEQAWPIVKEMAPGERLQVGINVIDLLIFALRKGARRQLEPFIEVARREMGRIWELTGGKVFFLLETPTLTILANTTRNRPKLMQWYLKAFKLLIAAIPSGAGWGFHFCYGRLGGKALGDHGLLRLLGAPRLMYHLGETVKMSNFMLHGLEEEGFVPEMVQYPFIFGANYPIFDPRYYTPLGKLYLPQETEIYAGAISPLLTPTQQARLIHTLDEALEMRRRAQQGVYLAGTCGWGSSSLEDMLKAHHLMRHVAYA